MVSKMRDLKSDLVHIGELLGVLVRKERSAETKAEIAARRLDRRDQESEAECEATLEEALTDHSKVVKVSTNGLSKKGSALVKPRQGRSSSSTPAQCRVLKY